MPDETRRIRTIFEVEGPEEGAAAVDRLADSIDGATTEAEGFDRALDAARASSAQFSAAQQAAAQRQADFSRLATEATQKAIDFTNKLAGAAGAVQSLASQLGQQGGTVGLIGSIAGAAAAGAQFGAAFGPQGAIVGGIVSALIPALAEVVSYNEEVAASAERAREQEELLAAASQRFDRERQRLIERAVASGRLQALTAAELERERRIAEERIAQLGEDIQEMERQRDRAGAESARHYQDGIDDATEALRRQLLVLGNLAEAQGRVEAQANAERLRAERAPAARTPRRGGGRDRYAEELAAWQRYQDAIDRGLAQELEARQRVAEAQQRQIDLMIEAANKARAEADAVVAAQLEEKRAIEAAQEERHARELERMREAQAANEAMLEANRAAYQRSREQTQETADLVDAANRGMVNAITEVILGTKSADEAFRGMLSAFLESIAEQALMKAAFEYAEGIAAFARYDIGGGAGHIAAGVAYTGVAIATGVAAGAVAPPAAGAQRADSPDRAAPRADEGGGRTVYVNNWNAPVAMAGTEADVGRTLDRLGRRASQRYGRIAA